MAYLGPSPARTPVTSDQITDASVTAAKLADDAVTTDKVAALTTLATNTIAETTAASGVTIDGLLIKDGAIPSIIVPGKNLFDNGEVSVDQRAGDTRTGLGATSLYLADRWRYQQQGTPTGRFTYSPGTGITGAKNSLRFEVTTADDALASDALYSFLQKFEAGNLQHLLYGTASAKAMTYQATIKTNWAGTMNLHFIQTDGSRDYATALTVVGDESQETFEIVIPGDASGTINNDTGSGLECQLTMAAGTDWIGASLDAWAAANNNFYGAACTGNFFDTIGNYFEISLMQIEVGSVATDFEHEDIGTTLAKCQRYFERISGRDTYNMGSAVGYALSTTQGEFAVSWFTEKRASPTISYSGTLYVRGNATGSTYNITNLIAAFSTRDHTSLTVVVASGLTVGRCYLIETSNTASDYFQADAEL